MTSRDAKVPSFCQWRAILGVMAVSLLASGLIALGRAGYPDPRWLLLLFIYGQGLGLFCAFGVCTSRAWLRRLSTRDAWLTAWLIVFLSSVAFSYIIGVVATVLGFGPGQEGLPVFMLKSVLAVSFVSVALFRYLFIHSQWEARVVSESEARVQALQARIRPHFLFNSLNTIASLIHDHPRSAERATEDLADLFRGGMKRADQLISLEEELSLARKYLDMERRRLGERLQVDWDIEGLPASASVLPMILQPLLENAVNHGIQPLPRGGELKVFGRLEGDNIVITIANPLADGPAEGGAGMALRNIRSRLELALDERASLITNQDDERFYAVLTLPHVEHTDH